MNQPEIPLINLAETGVFMKKYLILVFILLSAFPGLVSAEWQSRLDALLEKGFENINNSDVSNMEADETSVREIIAGIPSTDQLIRKIKNRQYVQPDKKGDLQLFSMKGVDGTDRPWVLYIPENYWNQRSHSLIIALHGGVSRKNISEDPVAWAKESQWLQLARSNGWLAIFPFGQGGATWWDAVGMTNIRRQLQLVKHHYNVDDDRVYLAGFSDGASAGFLYAMIRPDDFAAIVALNGHMGVGSLDGDLPTYAANMANTPIYAVTTDQDGLYPTSVMAPTINSAISAGADILYRQLSGTQRFDYSDTELPLISNYLSRHPRNTLPHRIYWETGSMDFAKCCWLEIGQILPCEAADWHRDHNPILVSDRITIGFIPEESQTSLTVGSVVNKSYAEKVGLKASDTIIAAAGEKIVTLADFDNAKSKVKRGDQFDMTVLREGKAVELKGRLPAEELYYLFKRTVPSAAVKAVQIGNQIKLETSRVGSVKIHVFPELLNIEKNIEVFCNGKLVFDGMVKPDAAIILSNYLKNRDRKMLPVAEILINLQK